MKTIPPTTKTVSEDYSSYEYGKSCNGGSYGFWTEEKTIVYEGKTYKWTEEKTTAEFDFDEITGSFQSTVQFPVIIRHNGKEIETGNWINTAEINLPEGKFCATEIV